MNTGIIIFWMIHEYNITLFYFMYFVNSRRFSFFASNKFIGAINLLEAKKEKRRELTKYIK